MAPHLGFPCFFRDGGPVVLQGEHFASRGLDPVPRSSEDHLDGGMLIMPLCPITEDCPGPEETLTEGYCILHYYFACHPHRYREEMTPWPFMEEANVEACNLLTIFVEFVGKGDARKLLTEAQKGWVWWMKFGLPTLVTPIIHKNLPHTSDSDLSVPDIQLAWKGPSSVAKLWSTFYGCRGLMKTIFKPSILRPILHLMDTLPDDDTEPGPMVPESTSITDRDLHTDIAQALCLQVSEITNVVLFLEKQSQVECSSRSSHSFPGSHQNSPLMSPCSIPSSLGSPGPTSHPIPPYHHHPPPPSPHHPHPNTTHHHPNMPEAGAYDPVPLYLTRKVIRSPSHHGFPQGPSPSPCR